MKRVAYILPGRGQKTNIEPYQRVAECYAARGITPVFLDIPWKEGGMFDQVENVIDQIEAMPPADQVHFFGFSLGAVFAMALCHSIEPRTMMLCSMSPIFAEDRAVMWPWMKRWARRRYDGKRDGWLSYTPAAEYTKENNCSITFLYGKREWWILNGLVQDRRRFAFVNSEVHIVPTGGHNIGGIAYLSTVAAAIHYLPKN